MRKIIFLILVINISSFAQFESQVGWIAKFGGAGGFSPLILFPNYDGVNSEIVNLGMNKFSGPIVAWGGGGYVYVMIVDNLRLGGIGFSGYQTKTSKLHGFDNEVAYSLGGGAVTVEYTFPFVKNMALSAGFMIGGGGINVDIYQNATSNSWANVWDNVINNTEDVNKYYNLSNSFFLLSPTINLDFPITRFIAVRGGLGYQFTFGNNWKISNGKQLSGVPSGLNGNGFMIQTGIYIGLFAF